MASMTDFEEWIGAGNEPDDHEEIYALWRAAQGDETGIYDVKSETDGQGNLRKIFIGGPSGDTLALLSPKAITAFRKVIRRYKQDDDLDWEGSYEYRRAMAKDD